jgi:hypothetical protein
MEVRVVCGFDATMASLAPSSAFSSVDFAGVGPAENSYESGTMGHIRNWPLMNVNKH